MGTTQVPLWCLVTGETSNTGGHILSTATHPPPKIRETSMPQRVRILTPVPKNSASPLLEFCPQHLAGYQEGDTFLGAKTASLNPPPHILRKMTTKLCHLDWDIVREPDRYPVEKASICSRSSSRDYRRGEKMF